MANPFEVAASRIYGPPSRRTFESAAFNRLTADFRSWIQSPSQDVKFEIRTLRARARSLENNNPHAKRFLRLGEKTVIGAAGSMPQPRNKMRRGGALHSDANLTLKSSWADWGRKDNCTVTGRYSWIGALKMALRTMMRDGEAFLRLWRYHDNPHGFAIQFLDADLFDETYEVRLLPNGNVINMSVELDPYGRPVAYWPWNQHPQDAGWGGVPLKRERIPATELLHLFLPIRDGQPRGVTHFAPVLRYLQMLRGYEEAELVAARTAAAKMGFITNNGEDRGPDPTETDDAERLMDASPGAIEELEPGQDFKQWDPQHPSGNYGPFINACLGSVAMGLDAAVASLTGDLSRANYSSLRSGALDERDGWRELQGFTVDHACDPVFRAWVPQAQLSGALPLAGPASRWVDVKWRPRGWKSVDPLKETQSRILEIDNGLGSRKKALAEQGEDFDEITDDLKDEQDIADAKGLVFGVLGNLPTSAAGEDGKGDNAGGGAGDGASATDSTQGKAQLLRLTRGL